MVSSGREWLFQGPFLSRKGCAFNCVEGSFLYGKFPEKSVVMKDFPMGTKVLVHCPGGVPEQIMNFCCEHLPAVSMQSQTSSPTCPGGDQCWQTASPDPCQCMQTVARICLGQ